MHGLFKAKGNIYGKLGIELLKVKRMHEQTRPRGMKILRDSWEPKPNQESLQAAQMQSLQSASQCLVMLTNLSTSTPAKGQLINNACQYTKGLNSHISNASQDLVAHNEWAHRVERQPKRSSRWITTMQPEQLAAGMWCSLAHSRLAHTFHQNSHRHHHHHHLLENDDADAS